MSDNIQHTPVPWSVASDDHEASLIATVGSVGRRSFGVRFEKPHEVNYEWHSGEDQDAAFIVEACNNYAALRSQLAEARECLSELLTSATSEVWPIAPGYAVERARALLAKLPEGR